MKSKNFWAAFDLQRLSSARFIALPLGLCIQIPIMTNVGSMDLGMFAGLIWTLGGLSIFMAYSFLFQAGTFGFRRSDPAGAGLSLEFPFSRALDRSTLYEAKLLWFFIAGNLPLLVLLGSSFWHPDRTIPFYPRAHATSSAFQDFYLSHFKHASLETSYAFTPQPDMVLGRIPKRHEIRLPYGQVELTLVFLWFGLVVAAVYQACLLGTLRSRWCQRLLPIAAGVIIPASLLLAESLDLTHQTSANLARAVNGGGPAEEKLPPAFDHLLAWVLQHPLLPLTGGALVIILALNFGRRRFVAQEVGP